MNGVKVIAIVEGHGEVEAVPVLIRRIAMEMEPGFVPCVLPSIRIPASRLIRSGEIERSVDLAARKLQGGGGIIVIVDCDDGCPASEGPALLQRAKNSRPDLPIIVILAKKEYEAWFLAAAESLRGKRNLARDIQSPQAPENIRGAKEWLNDRMRGTGYSETGDQAALTDVFDMALARERSDSFNKCYRDIRKMLEMLRQDAQTP